MSVSHTFGYFRSLLEVENLFLPAGQLFWFVIDTSTVSGFYEFVGMNTDDCHTGLFLAANSKASMEELAGKDACLQLEVRDVSAQQDVKL